jgi:threonine synthase
LSSPTAPTLGTLYCQACDYQTPGDSELAYRCPNADSGADSDHLLARRSPLAERRFCDPTASSAFDRHRELLFSWELAASVGQEQRYLELVTSTESRLREIDGRAFQPTPLFLAPGLAAACGVDGRLWVKDETNNVADTHKARHLMGIWLHLELSRQLGLTAIDRCQPLAIASCGNAALAAAVLARAADWPLAVYVPEGASAEVLSKLADLGATLNVQTRSSEASGDPCYLAFADARNRGALPFCCQGPDNGLTIDGGKTLVYELVDQLAREGVHRLDWFVVQVGGGALASACLQAFEDAVALGQLERLPRFVTVQSKGAYPLARAYQRLLADLGDETALHETADGSLMPANIAQLDALDQSRIAAALEAAARNRSRYMWPWEHTPKSVASAILDDETYDWWQLCRGMLQTGGFPLVLSEARLVESNQLARHHTESPVCATGSAGLAGAKLLAERGLVESSDRVAVVFTGRQRD